MRVFLLWHTRRLDEDDEDVKLLGVYSSTELAAAYQAQASSLPGFRLHLDGFEIDGYEVDENQWTSGFSTQLGDGTWVDDPDPA